VGQTLETFLQKNLDFPAICRKEIPMPSVAKTERLEARVPIFLKRIIQRAADLQGRSITDFVIASLDKSAREIVREHEVMKLNAEDSMIFANALIDPPKANAALRRAFAAHSDKVAMK
jgi:uncharacterized protein (DUF1778 family)